MVDFYLKSFTILFILSIRYTYHPRGEWKTRNKKRHYIVGPQVIGPALDHQFVVSDIIESNEQQHSKIGHNIVYC